MARLSGLPQAAARERTAEVLRHVGLYEERYRAIGGYSTGMKQRVKLAQALVHGPRLLLLDEPTNGLDPAGRDEMLALVRRTGTEFGIAVIVASHLLGEIERVCDFLVAIDAGRLLRAAPLGAFTERTGVLAIEVEEGAEALAEALIAAGLQAVADGRTVLRSPRRRTTTIVRDTIAELGCRWFARATPPEPRRPVPRWCRRRGPSSAGAAPRGARIQSTPRAARRQHLRPRLPGLRRAAARPPARVLALFTQTVRSCFGIGRGGRAKIAPFVLAGPGDPAGASWRSGSRRSPRRRAGRCRDRGRVADQLRELPRAIVDPDHAVLRRAGAGAVRARPALRRPAALLLARPDPDRLRAGQARAASDGRPARRRARPVHHPVRRARPGRPDPVAGLGEEIGAVPRVPPPGHPARRGAARRARPVIAACTPRRAYATAAIIAVFIIPPIIVAIIGSQSSEDFARIVVFLSPGDILDGTNAAIFGSIPDSPVVASLDLPGWAYLVAAAVGIVGSIGLTVRRYLRCGMTDAAPAARRDCASSSTTSRAGTATSWRSTTSRSGSGRA